jgi:N utilization substance protein B
VYQQDLLNIGLSAALERAGCDDPYCLGLVWGVDQNRESIDAALRRHLTGWKLERLGVLERAVLRVAAYELLREDAMPAAVVINEAVGLAKRFCSLEAGSLINGVLGSLATEDLRPEDAAFSGGGDA